MKMFLTRLGYGSKAVITGDVTQTDLPAGQDLGPEGGAARAAGHRRHPVRPLQRAGRGAASLVQDIITAYERADQSSERSGS